MKKICILYIQTSSIQKDYNISYKNYNDWTRIVSLNYIITNEFLDGFNNHNNHLIRPQGFLIDNDAEKFNIISNDVAINKGENINDVLKKFINDIENVDFFVGHNIEFHLNVLRSELLRNKFGEINIKNSICLMNYGIQECKIPYKNGYKFPTLEELYFHFTKSKISISKLNNQYIYLLHAVETCYRELFKNYKFKALDLIPDRELEFINIPFKKDDFPNKKALIINELDTKKFNISTNDIILFENVYDIVIGENWGLYMFKKDISISQNITEYYIIDYRGVIILKSENRPLNFGYCHIDDEPEIKVNGNIHAYVSFYINGIFIHNFSNREYISSLNKEKKIISFNYSDKKTTIVDNINGNIVFERENIIYDEDLNFFIKISDTIATVTDFNCSFLNRIILNGKNNLQFLNNSQDILFEINDMTGLMNLKGEILINPSYDYLIKLENNLIEFKKPNKHGLITTHDEVIFESDFSFEVKYVKDYLIVNSSNSLNGLFNNNGKVILPIEYDEVTYDEYFDYFELKKRNKNGLFLNNNNSIIPALFDYVEHKGRFIFVENNELEGVYNVDGQMILECKYKFGSHYNYIKKEFLELKNNDKYDLINLNNLEYVFKNYTNSRKIGRSDDFIICFILNDLVKYKNFNTNLETEFIYSDLNEEAKCKNDRQYFLDYYRFNDERLIIKKDGLYGYMDKYFVEIIKCQFEKAFPFKNGRAEINDNYKSFYIDIDGNEILL